jgi:hypothetical protein
VGQNASDMELEENVTEKTKQQLTASFKQYLCSSVGSTTRAYNRRPSDRHRIQKVARNIFENVENCFYLFPCKIILKCDPVWRRDRIPPP